MNKDDILGLLYDQCLATGALPELIADLESREDRIEVIRESIRIIETSAAARAAQDVLHELPPFIWSSGVRGDSRRFVETLFPFESGPGALAPGRKNTVDFWDWQRRVAKSVSQGMNPVIPVARRQWLVRSAADPAWDEAVSAIAGHYADFVRFAAEKGQAERWRDYQSHRQYAARQGQPDCGHVAITDDCNLCWQTDYRADEAHHGWSDEAGWRLAWGPREGRWSPVRQQEPCLCCAARHDTRPRGDTQCDLCAEAKFWSEAAFRSQRWGGWFWLTDLLRDTGRLQAQALDPSIVQREADENLVWRLQPWHEEIIDEIEALGTRPWSHDSFWEMDAGDSVGTVYLPVRILRTDLKANVELRAKRLLDEVWRRMQIKTPRSAAVTPRRQQDWARYLDWLWQLRVEKRPIEQVENADSPADAGATVDTRTIRRGVKQALRALRGY